MLARLFLPGHERQLIPEGRVNGPMPWMIAIMVLLTLLAVAAGLAMDHGARRVGESLNRKVTVQIVEPGEALREKQRQWVLKRLRGDARIRQVRAIPDGEARALLEPWLGQGGLAEDIAVPALIDAEFYRTPDRAALDRLRADLRDGAPAARLDTQVALVEPVTRLMRWTAWLTLGLVLLLVIATGATVVLAARSALTANRAIIDVVHLLGATDAQLTRIFQRRIALDALFGGMIGFTGGIILINLFGRQMAQMQSAMFAHAMLPWYGWAVLAAVPLAAALLASLVARFTIRAAIRKLI